MFMDTWSNIFNYFRNGNILRGFEFLRGFEPVIASVRSVYTTIRFCFISIVDFSQWLQGGPANQYH